MTFIAQRLRPLDALSERMDERFKQVEGRVVQVHSEMHELRVEMHARFDSLQRMLFLGAVAVIVALIGLGAT